MTKENEPTKGYLLRQGHDSTLLKLAERPTQQFIQEQGLGEWTLFKADGQVLKHYSVVVNRNGNRNTTNRTPDRLEGLSTLNLSRLVRYYERILKIWPEQSTAVKKVNNELDRRTALIAHANHTT